MVEPAPIRCMIMLSPEQVDFIRHNRQNGELPAYVGRQAVPVVYTAMDTSRGMPQFLCADCCNPGLPETQVMGMFLNWTDTSIYCSQCHENIEAARG